MTTANRFCVYVDWSASRVEDDVLASIGNDVIPDTEESETCIYWDERRPDVLVVSWNLDARDEKDAYQLASAAVQQAVGPVVPGQLGDVTIYALDAEDN